MTKASAPSTPKKRRIRCPKVGPGWTARVRIDSKGGRRTYSWHSPVKSVGRYSTIGGRPYYLLCLAQQRQKRILVESGKVKEETGWISTRK